MGSQSLIQLLPSLGGGGVLAFVVVALLRGWLVPGAVYERLRRQNEDLLNAVLSSTDAARLALETSKRRRSDEDAER